MIFLQVILIINTLVANISCTIFVNGNVDGDLINLKQKDAQFETTINLLKNTVDENKAKIQLLNSHVEELEIELQGKQLIPKLFKNHCLSNQSKELRQFNVYKMHSNFNLEYGQF